LASLDFKRDAVRQWIACFLAARSIVEAAPGSSFEASSGVDAWRTDLATRLTADLTALFLALFFLSCLILLIADL
jgi:hypothetical protein